MTRAEFDESDNDKFLSVVRDTQPAVFARMEVARRNLWGPPERDSFNSGNTMLFMTHDSARLWHQSLLTPVWHHPDFDPDSDVMEQMNLRHGIRLGKIVFDEPELDELLYIMPESRFQFLSREQRKHTNWRDLSHRERVAIFRDLRDGNEIPGEPVSFPTFDELMRM